jgi:hypothetical protein
MSEENIDTSIKDMTIPKDSAQTANKSEKSRMHHLFDLIGPIVIKNDKKEYSLYDIITKMEKSVLGLYFSGQWSANKRYFFNTSTFSCEIHTHLTLNASSL